MAANVNIYVAGDVVAGALANCRRRAANSMHVPISPTEIMQNLGHTGCRPVIPFDKPR